MSSPAADESKVSATVFPLNSEAKLVWLSGRHREVLKTLDTAIQEGRGVLLLTGESGSGKTILTRALLNGLVGAGVRVGRLASPVLDALDFYTVLAEGFPEHPVTGDDFLGGFRRFLGDVVAQGQRLLLVVDDAQALRPDLFAELLRLLEAHQQVDENQVGVFNVLLVGSSELETILRKPQHIALAKLIRVRCTLRPLTANEVAGYVRYHLGAAGLDFNWFTPEAMEEICSLSGGIPRMINVVCDRTLRAALLAGAQTVDAALVRQGVGDEMAEPVSEPEASAEPEPEIDDQPEDFDEADRRWRIVRVGGVAVLGVALAFGLLLYLGWRSPSRDAPRPATGKIVEQGPGRPETVVPTATAAPPPPSRAAQTVIGERPPAAVPEKVSPEPSVATSPPPLPPRAAPITSRERPRAIAAEKGSPRPPVTTMTSPPPARAPATVSGEGPSALAPEKASFKPPVTAPTPQLPARGAGPAGVAPPAPTTDEPDPGAIIDWLLKQSPRRPD